MKGSYQQYWPTSNRSSDVIDALARLHPERLQWQLK